MKIDTVTVIGVSASVFTALSLFPQLVKIYREKKAAGVSALMLATLFTGLSLWVIYGIIKEDMIITVSNGVSLLINAMIGILMFRYRRR